MVKIQINTGVNISNTLDIYVSETGQLGSFTLFESGVTKSSLEAGYAFTPPINTLYYEVRDTGICNCTLSLSCFTETTTTTAAPIVLPSTNHIVGDPITKVVLSDNGEYLYLTRTNYTYYYVEQYTLTTPYFIASRVITPYGYVFTNLGTNDHLDSVDCFSPNGQYVYTTNQLKITRYELGTPWIMSTLITSSKQSYNTYQYLNTASAISMSFSSNGLYVSVSSVKNSYGRIYVFSLPTAWSFVGITYHSVAILTTYISINGFEFSVDGNKMYIMNSFNMAKIIEYNVVGDPFIPVLNQTISNSYDFTSQMDTTALSRDFCLSSNKQYAYILSLPTLTVQSLVQFNLNAIPVTTTTTTSATRYVGESYGGGVIAYVYQSGDPGYIISEEHGIISDTIDISTGLGWGGYGTSIGTTSQLLNEGGNNTNEIVAALGVGDYAARLCTLSTSGGYSDWKLPSLYELRKLYSSKNIIGGFSSNYWSSSEHSSTHAWLKSFGTVGDESAANKQVGWTRIRAIRYF